MADRRPDSPYIPLSELRGLIRIDTRTPDQKALHKLMEQRDAFEMGAEPYPVLEGITLQLMDQLRNHGVVDPLARLRAQRWPLPVEAPALDAQLQAAARMIGPAPVPVRLHGDQRPTFAPNVTADTLQRSEWMDGAQRPWEDGIYEAEWSREDGGTSIYFNRWTRADGWHWGRLHLANAIDAQTEPRGRGRSRPIRWRGISAAQVERLRQGLEVFNG